MKKPYFPAKLTRCGHIRFIHTNDIFCKISSDLAQLGYLASNVAHGVSEYPTEVIFILDTINRTQRIMKCLSQVILNILKFYRKKNN